MPRGDSSHLIFGDRLSHEEAIKNGRKGGLASAEARRKKKTFREIISAIGNLEVTDPKLLKQLELVGINVEEQEITYSFLVNFAQFQKAIKEKDTRAAEYLRDTLGEKPTVKQQVDADFEDLTPLGDLLK